MPNSNYGKYEAPKLLEEIIQLQEQLNKQGLLPHGDLLGNYFAYQTLDERYMNTPLDAIGFAYPGMDGMHFAFLTDFGNVSDLSEAYIVRVSPMEFDCPVRIIARNLKDFVAISVTAVDAFYMIDVTKSQEEIEEHVKEYPPIPMERLLTDSEYAVERKVIETLHIEPIVDLVGYYRELKQMREQEVILQTEDSIGVSETLIQMKVILSLTSHKKNIYRLKPCRLFLRQHHLNPNLPFFAMPSQRD